VFADAEAVLFDMGGTLVDYPTPPWPVVAVRFAQAFLTGIVLGEACGQPPAASVPPPRDAPSHRSRARPDAPLAYRTTMALRRMIRSVSGSTVPRLSELATRPLVAGGRLVPDASAALAELRRRGYRLGLVSNTPWGTPDYLWTGQLERFGLVRFFEVTCFSSDVGFRKPDPRIFQAALKPLGVPPARAVFVGDEPEADIAGARGAGLASVWVDRHHRRPPSPAADLTITRLADLPEHLPGRPKPKSVDTSNRMP